MTTWFYTIISVIVVSLLSLIGVVTLALNHELLQRVLLLLVSFAVGALFGDAFIHLIPEAFRQLGMGVGSSLYVLAGILLFFGIEKLIRWGQSRLSPGTGDIKPMVALNLIIDGAHNMIDGMLIGASYSVSVPIGITTTLAVVLHEIPHEIGDFAILIHGGLSTRKALAFNFLSALTAVAGGIIALLLGPALENFSVIVLPITAGGFIYFAGSDLIPELHQQTGRKAAALQFLFIVLGIAFMALLLLAEF
jgi:zinc and cadmium transporter